MKSIINRKNSRSIDHFMHIVKTNLCQDVSFLRRAGSELYNPLCQAIDDVGQLTIRDGRKHLVVLIGGNGPETVYLLGLLFGKTVDDISPSIIAAYPRY